MTMHTSEVARFTKLVEQVLLCGGLLVGCLLTLVLIEKQTPWLGAKVVLLVPLSGLLGKAIGKLLPRFFKLA